jgi:hypothetical protein
LEPRAQMATSLEEAAQALATALYSQFAESVILARVYVTVPFAALPPLTRAFVQARPGAASALNGKTPVLSRKSRPCSYAAWR